MGRGRIPMELIQNEKARKTTFQKRKNNLIKKAYEFSTLCGVDVCLILYAPNSDGQGFAEPETWPKDTKEVHRIIQKYHNTTNDRGQKICGVEEYYEDRKKKVEFEISKIQKDRFKFLYPTWYDTFNDLGEEQIRMFVSILDAKLDACSQRLNMRKGDLKGKAIPELDKVQTLTPYLASNPSSYLNLMQNISQAQLFPPLMNMKSTSDNNRMAICPYQLGESSQPSMLHFDQNYMQLMGKNESVNRVNQVGTVVYDPKTGMIKEDGAENNQNFLPCYYNGNIQTIKPQHTIALQTLPSLNSQYEAACPGTLSNPPPGFQLNGFYDTNVLQAQMFNYLHGRK